MEKSDKAVSSLTLGWDISLEELRLALIEFGLHVSVAGLHGFFVRHGMTPKKRLAMLLSRTAPTS